MSERFIISKHAQGTHEWLMDRLGRVTGSKASCVSAKARSGSGEAVTRRGYRMDLVLERINQVPTAPTFAETQEIAWGKEQEPMSRMAFDMRTGLDLEKVGFMSMPNVMAGCSLDAKLVEDGKRGFWETKCPKSTNHYATILANDVPPEYVTQLVHNFWVTGFEFCYYQSFDPRMPKPLQVFLKRKEREEYSRHILAHEAAVYQFLKEVDAEEKEMRQRCNLD